MTFIKSAYFFVAISSAFSVALVDANQSEDLSERAKGHEEIRPIVAAAQPDGDIKSTIRYRDWLANYIVGVIGNRNAAGDSLELVCSGEKYAIQYLPSADHSDIVPPIVNIVIDDKYDSPYNLLEPADGDRESLYSDMVSGRTITFLIRSDSTIRQVTSTFSLLGFAAASEHTLKGCAPTTKVNETRQFGAWVADPERSSVASFDKVESTMLIITCNSDEKMSVELNSLTEDDLKFGFQVFHVNNTEYLFRVKDDFNLSNSTLFGFMYQGDYFDIVLNSKDSRDSVAYSLDGFSSAADYVLGGCVG